jgi:asparagine synthase (glutamine-hydrolysing)
MLDALRHRGPDDEGAWSGDGVWLGAVRLAIQDLSPAGHQPVVDPTSRLVAVLNGEIYNHLDLRRELGEHPWRGRSDTETLARAFAVWGPGCVERLRGMFAFAVFDPRTRTMHLARDRLGIKPLYVHHDATGLRFASEARALRAASPMSLDPLGVAGYVRFGAVPEPTSPWKGVRSVPAGCLLEVEDGRAGTPHKYWSLSRAGTDTNARTFDVRAEFDRSVREHLLADVPLASFLSGGLDSGLVTASAAGALAPEPVRTFTVGLDDPSLDETTAAERVAGRWGTRHETLRLSARDVLDLVPEAVARMDLPTIDGINTYVVSRAVRDRGCPVALSGLGGDELFGGYPSFRLLPRIHRWRRALGLLPAKARGWLGRGFARRERAVEMTNGEATLARRYESLRALWAASEIRAFGLPLAGLGADDPPAGLPPRVQVSILELSGYMKTMLLRDSDAMSMAASLELRVPFLDHRLVEACLSARVVDVGTPGRKEVLRAWARERLPAENLTKGKRGFVLPMGAWMRGPLRDYVRAGCEATMGAGILDGNALRTLDVAFSAGRLPWSRLWQFAVLGHWLGVRTPALHRAGAVRP